MNPKYYEANEEEIKNFFIRKKPIVPIYKVLTLKTIEYLKKYGKSSFASALCINADYWEYEVQCNECKKIDIIRTSRKELIEYVRKNEEYHCEECSKKLHDIYKKEQRKKQEKIDKEYLEFIDKVTNPNFSINEGHYKKVENDIKKVSSYYEETISKKLNALSYQDFLKTSYWKAVSNLIRRKAKMKCSLCNNENAIHVHHKTYKHHGKEMLYLNDLINLCNSCHSKFHEVEK